jgi:hypothetical protein
VARGRSAPPDAPEKLTLEPVSIGPTWQRDPETGAWVLPERTLGWVVLGWTAEYLRQPDGPDAGKPWRYTDEQARFMLWWYAVDEHGRFIYRSGMLRRVKGWGKDPVGATICATEFVGPCRFGGWDAAGDPVAIPHPASWVLTAAVAKDQTRNTMTLFPGLFSDAAINEYAVDLGKEIIYAQRGKCRLEAVTSSPRAIEGPRASFVLKNETQHWLLNNDGHEMSKVIARNATKSRDGSSRVLAISNAHEPGEDSDAERDYEAWLAIQQGKSRSTGFLYDSLEAPPETDLANELQLRAALVAARGDSDWLDEDRHVEEIYDPRNSPSTSRRFYLNQIVAAEDAWIAPVDYDSLKGDETVEQLADGEEGTLGFDGSKTDDHTVLMFCRLSDGYTFTLGNWDPEEHDGEAPRELIDGTVRNALERFTVCAFFGDLEGWESYIDAWALDYGKSFEIKATAKHAIAWDMRGHQKEATIEIGRLHDEIEESAKAIREERDPVFRHDGNKRTEQHFHNARRWPNTWGVTVRKEHRESKRKIDAVPATMLARMARRIVLANPKRKKKRTGKAAFV